MQDTESRIRLVGTKKVTPWRRRLWQGTLVLAGWTFIAVIFMPQTYTANNQGQFPISVWQALLVNLGWTYPWAAATPLMLWLGRRFPLGRKNLLRNFTILFLLQIPIVIVLVRLHDIANMIMFAEIRYQGLSPLKVLLVSVGAADVNLYWAMIGVSQALAYFKKYEEREFRLAQAQLQILKMQLHPHFLFNTLNAISELVYDAPEKADRAITQLSDLLRLSLNSDRAQEVILKDELDFLQKYIAIQQTLMQERLAVRWDIDPETFDALLPGMILQPLVENSIRHGIAPRARGGSIEISAHHINDMLHLTIRDDGLGLAKNESGALHQGVGLTNIRSRLDQLYGGSYFFDLIESAEGGVAISIALPFREPEERNGTHRFNA